ncbi:hypothetical protein [Tamaricihabitans halophyticus]|uniref:hypothetical protein n=1 Tax=Tamaricihabitans halophyticus TaxID=1262583 RepID=UPI001FB4C619|nr:hypothetical protein [Tamaricihabitans halophyticus]
MQLSNALFDLCVTPTGLADLNLHRHWRNARTHALCSPTHWPTQHIGGYLINGTLPPHVRQL